MINAGTHNNTKEYLRTLNLKTCILLTWGENGKINYARSKKRQEKYLENLFSQLVKETKNKNKLCKNKTPRKTIGTLILQTRVLFTWEAERNTKTTIPRQDTKKQTKLLETLISKHVYFSSGEKNEKKNEL